MNLNLPVFISLVCLPSNMTTLYHFVFNIKAKVVILIIFWKIFTKTELNDDLQIF